MKPARPRASGFEALAALGRAPEFSVSAFRAALEREEPSSSPALWAQLLREFAGLVVEEDRAESVGQQALETHGALVACLGQPVSLQTALLHTLHSRLRLLEDPRVMPASEVAALRSNSTMDPLTGLYNRRFIDDHFDRELSRAERSGGVVSAVLFDVAGFGAINERYGHAIGDAVLQSAARKIKDTLRVVDAGCRFGGDEFLVLLPNTDIVHGIEVAERIRHNVARARVPARGGKALTLDYGLATYPLDGRTRSFLLKMSDVRLFGARRARRDFPVERRHPRFLVPGLSLRLGSRKGARATTEVKDLSFGGLSFSFGTDKIPPLVEGEIIHRFSAEAHPVTLRTISVRPSSGNRVRVGCAYAS